ncbi:hypothetical protein HanPSC8_Chr15g0684341 [Helianthus annuus]|nr:hypothetical protein HanPSC8_Chr15g0684341 [Helianthus annuus]
MTSVPSSLKMSHMQRAQMHHWIKSTYRRLRTIRTLFSTKCENTNTYLKECNLAVFLSSSCFCLISATFSTSTI